MSQYTYFFAIKKQIYSKTLSYLTTQGGYKEEEIEEIQVTHSFMSKIFSYDEWGIKAVFKDEPSVNISTIITMG